VAESRRPDTTCHTDVQHFVAVVDYVGTWCVRNCAPIWGAKARGRRKAGEGRSVYRSRTHVPRAEM
jgi:hypothetical protein